MKERQLKVVTIHPLLGRGLGSLVLFLSLYLISCGQKEQKGDAPVKDEPQENLEAKAILQGVWLDSETEEPFFKALGDTIFFADATIQPAYFCIVGDSIKIGSSTYRVTFQTEHNFKFRNPGGDVVELVKREVDDVEHPEFEEQVPQIISTTEVINIDSVVFYGGQRYHWYITVNPTRYRVMRTTYTPDGVAVEKEYYDNIIHVSLFHNNRRLFTRDFNKQAYAADVPEDFLQQSILGNIAFDKVDAKGFYFDATVCIPDGESCYMIETIISFDGQLTMNLLE